MLLEVRLYRELYRKHQLRAGILGLSVALTLGGCTATRMHEPSAKFKAAKAACKAEYPDAVGNMAEQVSCISDAANQYLLPVYPYPDLLNVEEAYDAKIAREVDNRTISPSDGKLDAAAFNTRVTSIANERTNAAKRADAQSLAARAAVAGIGAYLMTHSQPQPPVIVEPALNCPGFAGGYFG